MNKSGFLCTDGYECPQSESSHWIPNTGDGLCCPVACTKVLPEFEEEALNEVANANPLQNSGEDCAGADCLDDTGSVETTLPDSLPSTQGLLLLPSDLFNEEFLVSMIILISFVGLGLFIVLNKYRPITLFSNLQKKNTSKKAISRQGKTQTPKKHIK